LIQKGPLDIADHFNNAVDTFVKIFISVQHWKHDGYISELVYVVKNLEFGQHVQYEFITVVASD